MNHSDPVSRVATGIKTALIVCVVGFMALVANRALVSPSGAAAADVAARPAATAPDVRIPATLPAEDSAMPAPTSSAESGGQ
jgi:hypothetical protein